jgi:putative oxidoreductase
MFKALTSRQAMVLGVLRIIVGLLFVCHGAQKVFGAFGGVPPGTPAFIKYLAGGIELTTGALMAIGFLTRPAAFLASGLMAFAYFMAHASGGFFPIVNHGELAVVYCFLFLYLAAAGPGAFSIEGQMGGPQTS